MTTTQSLAQQDPMPRGRAIAILAEAIEVNGLPAPAGITWQGFPGDGHAGKAGNHIMYLTFAHAGAVVRWAEWLGAKTEHRVMSDGTSITDANLKWHGWSTRLVTYTDTLCDWSAGCDNAPSGEGWFPGVCTEHAATVRAAFVSAVPTDPGETHACAGPTCDYAGMPTGDAANHATARALGDPAEARAIYAKPTPRLTPGTDADRAAAKAAMAATFVEPAIDLRHIGLTGSDRDEELSRDGHVALPPYVEGHAYGPDPSFVPGLLAEADTIPTTPVDAVVDIDATIASLAEPWPPEDVRWAGWPGPRGDVDQEHAEALYHNGHPGCPDCRMAEPDGDAGREEGFARWLDGVDAIPVVVVTVPAQDAEAGR